MRLQPEGARSPIAATKAAPVSSKGSLLLDVRGLRTAFSTDDGLVHAVNDVSFHVSEGETVAIVGESGSGKSVTMLSIMGLIPEPPGRVVAGEAIFDGTDLLTLDRASLRQLRGSHLAMIFQEPLTSLNPVFTVGEQIGESIRAHERVSRRAVRSRVADLLHMVNMPEPQRVLDAYPHQLSGGMCQRVMLAMAVACHPKLLIADEPTTALDTTTQAQLLELIRKLQADLGMAVIWITHDLGIVAGLADRVIVMYAGRVVEDTLVDSLYDDPLHPYTQGLLGCIPRLDADQTERLTTILGAPPNPLRPLPGCPFEPRCRFRLDKCRTVDPPLAPIESGLASHLRACWAPIDTLRADRK